MGKIRISVFIGLDLLAIVIIQMLIFSYIDQMMLVENLPNGRLNSATFMISSSALLSGWVAVLLSVAFLSKLPRPNYMDKNKRNKIKFLTIICGFYVVYRLIWTAYSFVESLTGEISSGKNLAIHILSGPLEYLCDKLAEGAIAVTQSFSIYWFIMEILPHCIISAMVFAALYGVRLLKKAPVQTAI